MTWNVSMKMFYQSTVLWLALFTCSSCSVGPDYVRPTMDLPQTWRVEATEAQDLSNVAWWDSFGDRELSRLVRIALEQNNDLRVAAARVEQYYALYGIARSEFFPRIDAGAGFSRQRSVFLAIPNQAGGTTLTTYDTSVNLNWELDLWGRIRRSTEAARSDILAQEAARRGVLVSVVSGVAQTYIELRELDKRLAITKGTLESRQHSLKLAQDRLNAGTSSELDLRQAESDLFSVQALIPNLEAEVARRENLLSVLLGQNPGSVARGNDIDQLISALHIPKALPSSLIDQRPDILEAEQSLRAANARIGVAKAAYFPTLSLTGLFGYVSSDLSDWLKSPGRQWQIGPDLALPLFHAGGISGRVDAARAQTAEALARYKQTVQRALQEVENSLVGYQKSREQIEYQQKQVSSLQRYLSLSEQRYNEGQSSYLEVLDAQRNLLTAELSLSQSQGNELSQFIALFRSLGGGWVEEADKKALQPDASTPSILPG